MAIIDINNLSKDQQKEIRSLYNKMSTCDIDKTVLDDMFSELVGFDCMNIKTWEDLVEHNLEECLECSTINGLSHAFPEERAAQAFMKIQYLIKHVYGGLPEHPYDGRTFVYWDVNENKPRVDTYLSCVHMVSPISFKYEDKAIEFITYPENVELLRRFYNIPVERLNY